MTIFVSLYYSALVFDIVRVYGTLNIILILLLLLLLPIYICLTCGNTFVESSHVGYGGRFGRGTSLYRHRSQLFGRLWVRLLLPTRQFFRLILGL